MPERDLQRSFGLCSLNRLLIAIDKKPPLGVVFFGRIAIGSVVPPCAWPLFIAARWAECADFARKQVLKQDDKSYIDIYKTHPLKKPSEAAASDGF